MMAMVLHLLVVEELNPTGHHEGTKANANPGEGVLRKWKTKN